MNILHLTPAFNYVDGRSYYVFLLLKYLKRSGHNVFLYTNGGDSFDRLEELDIPVFSDTYLSSKSSFIKSVNLIFEFTKKNKIHIIHSHHRYFELIANSVSSIYKPKLKTVFTALSIIDKRYLIEYKSDKIIAVSNSVKNMLTGKFNIKKSKIVLIPNFTDSEESDQENDNSKNVLQKSYNANQKTHLLSIGRFHKEKDYNTLLNAVSILKDLNIDLTLIGEGSEKASYVKFIRENSLKVELISPRRNLKEYFQKTDICILPSVRDPFPGFMLQSGLHKKPFIGSDVDGISELIVDNQNGLLFKKRNPSDLSEKIKKFIVEKDLARECGENLQTVIKKKYTEKIVIPMIEEVYYNLTTQVFCF